MRQVKISADLKRQFLQDYHDCIAGTLAENTICALVILSMKAEVKFSAIGVFNIYKSLCDFADLGMAIYIPIHPELKGAPITRNVKLLKGKKTLIFSPETLRKIAGLLSGEDEEFCQELEKEFRARVSGSVLPNKQKQ